MTINERVSDERIASVIETLEHYATNLKWAADHSGPDLILAATALRELQQYRAAAAEPVLYCMEGDTLDDENVSTSKAVVDAWVEEWNGEGRCPGEPQYRTVPLYRHAAPQVTSVPAVGNGRDQFEEWFKFHHGDEHSNVKLHRANSGANYRDQYVDLAWIAWKDSRAAMLNGGKS